MRTKKAGENSPAPAPSLKRESQFSTMPICTE
jgi:hypothetical protein